jgi:hypothetical protein
MTIFVSIASYRDRELVKTVDSLISQAKNPNGLHIGIYDQDYTNRWPDISSDKAKISHQKVHMKDARGAGFARKKCMEMYNGEDFFFQIDSHMRFAKDWDIKLIEMTKRLQEKNQKIILSQFPAPYQLWTNGKEYFPQDDSIFWSDPSWTSVVFTYRSEWAGNREIMFDKTKPHLSYTILAGYVFSPGNLVEEVPYDERISFMGEELCFAFRAYTRGWDIYAPNEMLVWHFYNRKDHPKIWNQRDDIARETKWRNLENQSKSVQRSILEGKEEGIFGVEKNKRFYEYQKMIGIDFTEFYKQIDSSLKKNSDL